MANYKGFDIEGAKIMVTAMLSNIFFARGSFPPDCFRILTWKEMNEPSNTHDVIVRSGEAGTATGLNAPRVLEDPNSTVYIRRLPNRPRVNTFLDMLESDIFSTLRSRRLGKIQVCFTSAKKLQPKGMLEYYSLKFSYSESREIHLYIDWAGLQASLTREVRGTFERLRLLLKSRPPFSNEFFTTFFLFSIDGRPINLSEAWTYGGCDVRLAGRVLENAEGSGSGRIGTLTVHGTDIDRPNNQIESHKQRESSEAILAQRHAQASAPSRSSGNHCYPTQNVTEAEKVAKLYDIGEKSRTPRPVPKRQKLEQSARLSQLSGHASTAPHTKSNAIQREVIHPGSSLQPIPRLVPPNVDEFTESRENTRPQLYDRLPIIEQATALLPATQAIASQTPSFPSQTVSRKRKTQYDEDEPALGMPYRDAVQLFSSSSPSTNSSGKKL